MKYCSHNTSARQRGYILLFLILLVTILSIGLMKAVEDIAFEIKRDREEEFIHRGLEYSRAVRKYVKAFGRYPNSIDALENTNNIRFLRKRFKDPITGKDFKLLYYADLNTFNATTPRPPTPPMAFEPPTATIAPNGEQVPAEQLSSGGPLEIQQPSSEPQVSAPSDQATVDGNGSATPAAPSQSQADAGSEPSGGRAIVGVTSYSSAQTIRIFNHKDHYNQWQFVYDPSTDHIGLMTTPNQPIRQAATAVPAQDTQQSSATVPSTGEDATRPAANLSQPQAPER